MDRNEIYETAITELTEAALAARRESCGEDEKEIYREVGALAKEAKAVMEKLPEKERQVLDEYFTKTSRIAQQECEYLYVQGARDCVKLLKKLGVL
ncbi:MAG: hypothetical protein LUC60_01340 [Lachnospiraceae bacterium]|nr:hypothetical protein [Lachnospiraceae bacterium]